MKSTRKCEASEGKGEAGTVVGRQEALLENLGLLEANCLGAPGRSFGLGATTIEVQLGSLAAGSGTGIE